MAGLIGMGTMLVTGRKANGNGNREVLAAILAINQQINAQSAYDSATRDDLREIKWLLVANGKAIDILNDSLNREANRRRS